MIIAIDTNCILPGQVGGIENYTLGLIEALKLPSSPATRLILLTRPENQELFSKYIDFRTTTVLIERGCANWSGATQASQLRDYQQRKSRVLLQHGVDLLHCPGNTINPLNLPLPVVLNLHDLQHRHYPEYFTPGELASREKWWTASAHRAEALLAASNYVRDDLHAELGVNVEKVFVTPDAFESTFLKTPGELQLKELRQRLDLPATFFLYPAACWPHKNHARLIRAFASADLPNAQLILTGGGHDQLSNLSIPSNIRLLGRVDTADLVGLYHLATAMVFPSQHESWSIPIAEAMACGCPVACSNVTSLPEQIGDAGLLFPADDEMQMTRAIRLLASDFDLRKTLADRGRRRVKDFGTESFLNTVSAAYHHAFRSFYARKAA